MLHCHVQRIKWKGKKKIIKKIQIKYLYMCSFLFALKFGFIHDEQSGHSLVFDLIRDKFPCLASLKKKCVKWYCRLRLYYKVKTIYNNDYKNKNKRFILGLHGRSVENFNKARNLIHKHNFFCRCQLFCEHCIIL